MRLFLIWPDKSQEVVNMISALEEHGHKVVYWLGYEGSDPDAPVGTIFHSYRDALLAVPPKNIDASEFTPPDAEIIKSLYKTESLMLTMMNRVVPDMNVSERKHLYYDLLRYWLSILKKYKPDLIIFSIVPHHGYDYLLYELASLLGIKTLMFLDTRIPGRILYFEDFRKGSEALRAELLKNKDKIFTIENLSDDVKKYYQTLSDKGYSSLPPHIQYQKNKHSVLRRIFPLGKIQDSLRESSIFQKASSYFRRLVFQNGPEITRKFLKQTFYLFKNNLQKEYSAVQSPPDLSKKFVYVPLHVQPECSTSPQGDIFVDQIFMIETLLAALPRDWMIYVKEHPIQWLRIGKEFSSYKYEGYYRKISEISNVKMVPMETDSYKLINQSQAVVNIAGAAGWEAMLRSKPAIIFGYPWYKDCPSVLKVNDVESCKAALQKVANGLKIDQRQIINYLKSLDSATLRAYIADSAGKGSNLTKFDVMKNITEFILTELDKYKAKIY